MAGNTWTCLSCKPKTLPRRNGTSRNSNFKSTRFNYIAFILQIFSSTIFWQDFRTKSFLGQVARVGFVPGWPATRASHQALRFPSHRSPCNWTFEFFFVERNGKWRNLIKKYPLLDSKEAGIMNIWRSQNLVFSRYQQNWQVELTRLTLDKPAWRYICSLACKPRIGLSSAKYLG